ncbi:hypothetical protein B7755_037330 [Streptomyces sp. NBS 14/10]|uniref:hypothetical protein n=1 Tax=Streptomyces sp. NBS 14/10 TaxID=1945643 RepID=UPI000B9C7BDA|nr:hypothetical protein [Streptomyces sp. NBS 14/10]KAK1183301.1 hypothetical protein B7755_037330 [Streptomyces sp. NBS 14/10]
MSTEAEQARSPHRIPPPRPAHPPHTAPPPGATPGAGPLGDPDTPILGVPLRTPRPNRGGNAGAGTGGNTAGGTAAGGGTGIPRARSADSPPRPTSLPPRPTSAPPPPAPAFAPRPATFGPWRRPGRSTLDSPYGGAAPDRPAGRRTRGRVAAAAASLVLGLGLLGGAAAGSWLTGDSGSGPADGDSYARARSAWHSVPVDELFPRTLRGAGPGGADRDWTRIAVAPDSSCGGAFDPLLEKALAPVGCKRLLRATYTDATSTGVTTVGLLVTKAGSEAMRKLSERFQAEGLGERADLMPRPYAAKGTAAAGFGDAQRASWRIRILPDAPAVVYTVSGFADGRKVSDPQPAGEATRGGATTAPAQSGLGHDARGIADEIERAFRRALSKTEDPR